MVHLCHAVGFLPSKCDSILQNSRLALLALDVYSIKYIMEYHTKYKYYNVPK